MKIATKTLVSLLIASATVSRQPTLGSNYLVERRNEKLERLLAHHDRKCELRADLLNIDPADLRVMLKKQSLREIATARGFPDIKSFRHALHSKIRDELRRRGWSLRRIETHISEKQKALDKD